MKEPRPMPSFLVLSHAYSNQLTLTQHEGFPTRHKEKNGGRLSKYWVRALGPSLARDMPGSAKATLCCALPYMKPGCRCSS